MVSNSQTFRELQSLREELSTARREGPSPTVSSPPPAQPHAEISHPASNGSEGVAAAPPKGATEESQRGEDIRELVDEITTFFEEAEKNITAHPAAVAIGAFAVGLIIGWAIRRR